MNDTFKNYHHLERNDVMIKIFLGKSHKKADVRTASNITLFSNFICKNGRFCSEFLVFLRTENIVFMKMIGDAHPAKNLLKMVKENPKKVRKYLREILTEINKLPKIFWDHRFLSEKVTMNGILWHNNSWIILDRESDDFDGENCKLSNFITFIEIFKGFGLSIKEILEEFSILQFTETLSIPSSKYADKTYPIEVLFTDVLKTEISTQEKILRESGVSEQ